jgi:hypothetical protein
VPHLLLLLLLLLHLSPQSLKFWHSMETRNDSCILDLEVVVEERCERYAAMLYPANAARNRALVNSKTGGLAGWPVWAGGWVGGAWGKECPRIVHGWLELLPGQLLWFTGVAFSPLPAHHALPPDLLLFFLSPLMQRRCCSLTSTLPSARAWPTLCGKRPPTPA